MHLSQDTVCGPCSWALPPSLSFLPSPFFCPPLFSFPPLFLSSTPAFLFPPLFSLSSSPFIPSFLLSPFPSSPTLPIISFSFHPPLLAPQGKEMGRGLSLEKCHRGKPASVGALMVVQKPQWPLLQANRLQKWVVHYYKPGGCYFSSAVPGVRPRNETPRPWSRHGVSDLLLHAL